MESSIKIDSICIDLANSNERIDKHRCEHFSIRGYVAETRKRDWKICVPFSSDGDSNKCEEQACVLPPLQVPEFRFWRCQNCLQEIGGKGTAIDHEEFFKHRFSAFASDTVCSHLPTLSDAAKLTDFQLAAKQDICQPKKIDGNASSCLNNPTEYHPLSCTGKKEKKAELACCPAVDKNLESEDMNHNANALTCAMPQVISGLGQKTCHANEKVSKPSFGCYKVSDAELAQNHNCIPSNVAKICERKRENSLDNQHKELKGCKAPKEFNNVNEALGASEDFVNGGPPLELDECDYLSSESAEIMIGVNIQNETSSGLNRRKTRKVRLLTELLCKGDGDSVYTRTVSSPPDSIPDSSKEADKYPISQETVATPGEVKRGLSSNRKRKLSEDEGLRALEGSTNKIGKEVRVSRRDVEAADAIHSSALRRDEYARSDFQNVLTSQWTKHKTNKNSFTGKKKKKKAIVSDERLPLDPSQSNMPIEIVDKDGVAVKNDVAVGRQVKFADNALTGSEMALFPFPAHKMDGEACKGKVPQSSNCHVSLFPPNHGMLREGPVLRSAEVMHMGPAILSFHSAEDPSLEKGLNLSLSSYTDTQRCKNNYIPLAEDSRISSLRWQEAISKEQAASKAADARFIGNFSLNAKSAQNLLFAKGINIDSSGERPFGRMSFHNDEHNRASQFEIGGCSHMQQKNVCCPRNNERTVGIQEHSEVSRKDVGQRADKVSDLGAADDIPMDIVELMAKNQYERRLPDAEYSKVQLDIGNNNGSRQATNFSRVYGHSEFSLFQQNSTQKLDFWAKTGKNVSETEQKLVDYFAQADRNQFNMKQLEKTQTNVELGAFLQGVRMPPSGRLQHSASAPGKHDRIQTCQWLGDIVGEKSSNNSLQSPAPCDTCQIIPQQSRTANHLWSSMMPSHFPFAYNIPPKCSSLPVNSEVLSRSSGSACKESVNKTPDMRFLNQNATNLAKQTGNFGSESLSHRLSEYPFSCKHKGIELNQKPAVSGDLYSNETIPAMHLLSLMDAKLRSSAPIMDVTTNSLKRPSLTHDHNSKECSRLDVGAHKLTGSMKHVAYDYRGKNQLVENCHEHIPAIQRPVGTSASSLRHSKSLRKATDLFGQVYQEKERKGFDSRAQNKVSTLQKHVSSSGDFGQSCGSIPVHNFSLPFGASDPGAFPLPFHSLGNSAKHKLESCSTTKTIHPHRSRSQTEICSVNRNPADFCIPEGNVYMIAGEELKSRNFLPSAYVSRSTKLDGRKRQRKLPALKEHKRHPVS